MSTSRLATQRALLLDRLGLSASVLCLVHCLVLPFVLVGLSAWASVEAMETWLHAGVALLAVPAALLVAVPGYREHRRKHVPALLALGVALLVASFVLHDAFGEMGHYGFTVGGSLLLVAGHVQNYRLRRRCNMHALPHHEAHHDGHSS